MVAAIVAGDADGIAEAYDRYAASLYAYGHWLLPGPEAAEVVPFLSRSRGWTGSVILTGSMPGCTPWRGTSACAGWARDCPEAPEDPLGRPRRFPAQRIWMNCRPSRFRSNSAGGC